MRLSFAIQDEAEPPLGDVVEPEDDRSRHGRRHGDRSLAGKSQDAALVPALPAAGPGRASRRRRPIERREPEPSGRSAVGPSPPAAEPSRPGRPPRRLDDFVTGPGNRLAHAAAREMIHTAGPVFNPLVIHGGVGLGKTHLLEGIAHGLRPGRPGLNVLWLTAEAFTNSFLDVDAGRHPGIASAPAIAGVGALAIDDIHFLAGTRATQSEFLHTFNALIERGRPDHHDRRPASPPDLPALTDELVTRFLGGMVVKLDTPDLATRRAILQAKVGGPGGERPRRRARLHRRAPASSVRELEGALHSVIAHALLTGKRLDLALARTALRDTIRHTAPRRSACATSSGRSASSSRSSAEALKSESRARARGLSPDAGHVPGTEAHRGGLQRDRPPLRRPQPLDGHLGREEGPRLAPATSSRAACCPASRPWPTSSPTSSRPWGPDRASSGPARPLIELRGAA